MKMFDLNLIKPKAPKGESDKYSYNIYRYLKNGEKFGLNRVFFMPSDEDDEFDINKLNSRKLFIARRYLYSGDLVGHSINRMCGEGVSPKNPLCYTLSCGWRTDLAIDVTDEFFEHYQKVGRCALFGHDAWLLGTEERFTFNEDQTERTCNWCGKKQKLEEEREVKVYHYWKTI